MLTRRALLRGSAAASVGALAGCGLGGDGAPGVQVPRSVPGKLLDSGASLGHHLRDGVLPAPSAVRQARVVIAGAGISGLAAARVLKAQGVKDVLMLDVLDAAGGNSSFGTNAVSAYPWGAHYVPLVRQDCTPVLDLFRDLEIIVDADDHGRPVYNEYCLSSDPQERLWMYGRWQEGLIPQLGSTARDRAEFTAFFAFTEKLKGLTGVDGKPVFAIPLDGSSADPNWRALDSLTFTDYLRKQGYQSDLLHWYINYCCRDDYGTRASEVSAWAGLHYFAARNGIAANADPSTVVTWPEGNGHLARELTRQSGATQQYGALVTKVARSATGGVTVDYFDVVENRTVRVNAAAAVVCLPRFVAARVVEGSSTAGLESFSYAPWMVANLTLNQLPAGRGQELAWDNVVFDSELLGYVDATHQSIEVNRRRTVITYYWPLSHQSPATARKAAIGRSLEEWQGDILRDLLRVHPELATAVENIDVRVWGHAMIRPTPGFIWGDARRTASTPQPPIYFAHSDLSGISIFEEAYCRGHEAGMLAARGLA